MSVLAYLYYASVVHSYRLIRRTLVYFVPNSSVENALRKIFAQWRIKLTDDSGRSTDTSPPNAYDKSKYDVELVIHNQRFYKSFVNDDLLALGEAYMNKWVDSDSIPQLVVNMADVSDAVRPLKNYEQYMDTAWNKQTMLRSKQVVDEHYNIGNDFYESFLGPTMGYTCGYQKCDPSVSLDDAQIAKFDLVARKLYLKPGMKIMEIGSGWGIGAKYMAEKYGVSVVGYTISEEQLAYARQACQGLDVEFRLEDYRNATGLYDRIYSIGCFEHIGSRNYRNYFEVCERCLQPDGLMLIHSITVRDRDLAKTERWLNKYIFPGGELPVPHEYFHYSEGLFIVEDVHNFGYDYTFTLTHWHNNLVKNWPTVKDKYAHMYNGRFFRMMEYYLLFSHGTFKARAANLYQVVFSKRSYKDRGYVSIR